jgi:hypothetical protein
LPDSWPSLSNTSLHPQLSLPIFLALIAISESLSAC